MNACLKMVLALLGIMALSACGSMRWIEEFPEPWQVIEPGKPTEKPLRVEVVTQGEGAVVEIGDIVQVQMKTYWGNPNKTWRDRGFWWVWAGFASPKDTTFYNHSPRVAAAFLGQKQGTSLRFLEAENNWISAGKFRLNPIGDYEYFSWRKSTHDFWDIYVPTESGYSLIEITRVCKGKAQYRTVRLFDDSAVQRCTWAPIECSITREPREGWVDEAKIEAVCSDGRTATFHYGPVASRNGKQWSGPINPHNYFEPWETEAWKKLPTGVQLK